jgi:chaperone modulatory protein CbpM
MADKNSPSPLSGDVLEEDIELSLADLCRICQLSADRVLQLVDEGLLEPGGSSPKQWRFHGRSVRRVHCVIRLQRDLGVNLAGAALALDLLEEVQRLRTRLSRFQDRDI